GAEQPFVAGGDGEIGLDVVHAEGQRTERLREIENERGSELAASLADADEVELPAARPVHVRQRGDGHIGGQRVENGRSPVVVIGPGNDLQRGSGFFRPPLPGIVVRWKLFFEYKNALSFFDRKISRGGFYAVAGRGNDGDTVGGTIEQPSSNGAKFLGSGEKLIGRNLPRLCFAGQASVPGLNRRLHQRRHVGAVQVGNVVGDIEEMALRGNHGLGFSRRSFVVCRLLLAFSVSIKKGCGDGRNEHPSSASAGRIFLIFSSRIGMRDRPNGRRRGRQWLAGFRARSTLETGNQCQ